MTFAQLSGEIEAADLQSLAVKLPNLTELGFGTYKQLTKNDLFDFFQSNSKLEKIFLTLEKTSENCTDHFKNETSEEFHVCDYPTAEGWGVFSIERKHSN